MEQRNTKTIEHQPNFASFTDFDRESELTQQRLNALLEANARKAREKSIFRSEREKFEADSMTHPISIESACAYFGLLLGTLAPAAMFTRFIIDARILHGGELWILGVLFIVNLIAAIVGFFSGKFIGRVVGELERISWHAMILTLPFIGAFWGIMAGGASGAVIFVVGAFFGALLGGAVGSFALTVFTIFHRLLKRGDKIERKHFLPLAFGIALIVSAFFLGL